MFNLNLRALGLIDSVTIARGNTDPIFIQSILSNKHMMKSIRYMYRAHFEDFPYGRVSRNFVYDHTGTEVEKFCSGVASQETMEFNDEYDFDEEYLTCGYMLTTRGYNPHNQFTEKNMYIQQTNLRKECLSTGDIRSNSGLFDTMEDNTGYYF